MGGVQEALRARPAQQHNTRLRRCAAPRVLGTHCGDPRAREHPTGRAPSTQPQKKPSGGRPTRRRGQGVPARHPWEGLLVCGASESGRLAARPRKRINVWMHLRPACLPPPLPNPRRCCSTPQLRAHHPVCRCARQEPMISANRTRNCMSRNDTLIAHGISSDSSWDPLTARYRRGVIQTTWEELADQVLDSAQMLPPTADAP